MKVLITTVPFGASNRFPIEMLEQNEIEYLINPFNKKITEDELISVIADIDVLIAGTEMISQKVMDAAPKLKLISRVGVGLDGVDLLETRKRGIKVSYTPEAPAPAVAELTIGLLITLLRNVQIANHQLHSGVWERHFGLRIAEATIGIIGLGRIGQRVLNRLQAFGTPRLLGNDLLPDPNIVRNHKLEWVDKETIYQEADAILVHTPLTPDTIGMISEAELKMMKKTTVLINTARGGIISEAALHQALKEKWIRGAAIDVFEKEPYDGPLNTLPNCLLTSHMGSMSLDCRERMEIDATDEAVRFIKGMELRSEVPEDEYALRGN